MLVCGREFEYLEFSGLNNGASQPPAALEVTAAAGGRGAASNHIQFTSRNDDDRWKTTDAEPNRLLATVTRFSLRVNIPANGGGSGSGYYHHFHVLR